MFGENLDPNDTITVDGMVYYRAISGKYTSYSELMAEIDRYCSENVISECDLKSYSYCEGNNDSLYIWEDADSNGGVMGYDVAYITSIETLNDSSVKVNMTAWGDKDEWGYEDGDSVIPFEITMISENGLWKIDKCGLMEMNYITWLFDADYSACSFESFDNTTINQISDATVSSVQITTPEASIADVKSETAALENIIQNLINDAEPPQIVITDNSTQEEILQAGKTAADFYGKLVDKYFEYGVSYNWKMASGSESGDIYTDEKSNSYYKCYGLYTDKNNDIYVPMNFSEIKHFLMSYIMLSENGFNDLCKNSPSKYIDVDGVCFLMSGDGGQAGWDYSYIKDYEISDNNKIVTFNCERFGSKENWGYDNDLTEAFTFSIVNDNGIWKLDGCSDCEAFCSSFIGSESDIEDHKAEQTAN